MGNCGMGRKEAPERLAIVPTACPAQGAQYIGLAVTTIASPSSSSQARLQGFRVCRASLRATLCYGMGLCQDTLGLRGGSWPGQASGMNQSRFGKLCSTERF